MDDMDFSDLDNLVKEIKTVDAIRLGDSSIPRTPRRQKAPVEVVLFQTDRVCMNCKTVNSMPGFAVLRDEDRQSIGPAFNHEDYPGLKRILHVVTVTTDLCGHCFKPDVIERVDYNAKAT